MLNSHCVPVMISVHSWWSLCSSDDEGSDDEDEEVEDGELDAEEEVSQWMLWRKVEENDNGWLQKSSNVSCACTQTDRDTQTRMHAAQQHLFLRIHTCTQGIKWEGAYQILWKLKRAFESGLNVGICTKYWRPSAVLFILFILLLLLGVRKKCWIKSHV